MRNMLGAVTVAAALVAIGGQAQAGSSCATAGARYSSPKVAGKPAAVKVERVSERRVTQAQMPAHSGGDGDGAVSAPAPALKGATATPNAAKPVEVQVRNPGDRDGEELTSVSAVAARLAAMAAQQARQVTE